MRDKSFVPATAKLSEGRELGRARRPGGLVRTARASSERGRDRVRLDRSRKTPGNERIQPEGRSNIRVIVDLVH